jgi:hypothetical protein
MSSNNDEDDLTTLQSIFFWSGFLLPIPSIILYVFFTEGTIEFFGGTPSPTALFWCSIAASGDAAVSVLCWCVLRNPKELVLRKSVLLSMAIYSIFHFGGFLKAHYLYEPQPNGPVGYIISILLFWAAYFAWGFRAPSGTKSGEEALVLLHEKQQQEQHDTSAK